MSANSNRDSGASINPPVKAHTTGRKSAASKSQTGAKGRHNCASSAFRCADSAKAASDGAQFINRKTGLTGPSGGNPGSKIRTAR